MTKRYLGRLPHDPDQVAAQLPLTRYLSADLLHDILGSEGPDWTRSVCPGTWGMYGNDTCGDCTAAAMVHAFMEWGSYVPPIIPIDDPDGAIALYSLTGLFVPGHPETDNGARCIDVLNYCIRNAVSGNRLTAFARIDPKNHDHVEAAIRIFGGVYTGATLRKAQEDQQVWSLRDGDQTIIGGHCFWVPATQKAITWGEQVEFEMDWWDECVDECYALLSPQWLRGGQTPAGFPAREMAADMRYVSS